MQPTGPISFRSRRRERIFEQPFAAIAATKLAEIGPGLERVAAAVARGAYAAGFIAYEAAPAFDPAMKTRPPGELPLLWFGLYRTMREQEPERGEPSAAFEVGPWQPLVAAGEYRAKIQSIRGLIAAGDTYQVNYTFPLRATFRGDTRGWFASLCAAQQADYCAYLDLGRYCLLSASPELFFRLEGNSLETRPMKGTRPRGRWPAADQALAQELAASEKERAENVMIVDLLRNDLTKISEAGSVQAGPLYEVEAYPTVWQMTSTIRSRTRAAVPEIMGALFPSGSVTGAPKIRTMEIIRELEPFPRGIYCGTIGWWAPDGRAEFNVAIRTVIVDTHAGQASYQVGSGITYGSAAEDEYAECLVKAALLTRRMPAFDLLETLRYDGAYVLLAEHLERLAASARYFGFACDRPAIEHALLAAAARETAVGKDGMKSVPLPQPLAPDSSKEGTRQETHPRPLQGGEMTQFISEEESRIYSTSPEARGCDHTASNITEPDTSPSLPGRDFLPPLPGGAGGGSSSSTQPANLAGRKVRLLLRKDGSFTIQQEPLPASNPLKVGFAVQPVDMNDILLYHKTTGRDIYRQALAARPDCDDVLLWNARDEITESTLANVVLELEDGRWTPPLASGLLGGTFRRHLLAQGAIAERVLTKADARRARAMHLINSVRGWIPVRWLDAARP